MREKILELLDSYDKKTKVDLKRLDFSCSKKEFNNAVRVKEEKFITAMVCVLNNIDIEELLSNNPSKKKDITKKLNIKNPYFKYISILNLENESKNYRVTSLIYKLRFLTFVYSFMQGYVNDVACAEMYLDKVDKDELSEKYSSYIKRFSNDFKLLVKCMLDDDYKNIILKCNYHLMCRSKRDTKQKAFNEKLINGIKTIRTNSYNEDILIYNLISISYMLTTGRSTIKELPNFEKLEGITLNHSLIFILEKLGKSIYKSRKKVNLNPMFYAYIYAKPKVETDLYYSDEYNDNVKMGIMALSFTRFILNEERFDEFIDKMLMDY